MSPTAMKDPAAFHQLVGALLTGCKLSKDSSLEMESGPAALIASEQISPELSRSLSQAKPFVRAASAANAASETVCQSGRWPASTTVTDCKSR